MSAQKNSRKLVLTPVATSIPPEQITTVRITRARHQQLRAYIAATDSNVTSAMDFILRTFFERFEQATGRPLINPNAKQRR